MKKIIIFILLTISTLLYSKNTNTMLDVSLSPKTIGFDIGDMNNRYNIYTKMDFGFYYNNFLPAYFNFDVGYVFKSNIYLSGILGAYVPYSSSTIRLNYGGEIGYIINIKDTENNLTKGIILSTFCTNNTVGLKFGFVLDSNLLDNIKFKH